MARVYRPAYTVAVPKNATPCVVKGRPAVRWKGRGGAVRVGVVCADNPARCRVESAKWYASYRDADGVERCVPGYADKGATEALLAKLVRQAAQIGSGLLPPEAAQPRATLGELVGRWADYLRDAGGGEKHVARQRQRVEAVIAGVKATRPADLTPARVSGWVARQQRERRDFGKRTGYHYVGAAKAFTRWLAVVERYEPVDHLSALKREIDETDRRHARRVLPQADLDRLLTTTAASPTPSRGLTGIERSVLYATAASTGLRASELASLTADSFDLDADPPTVTVLAAYAKNRRTDELYLPAELVPRLRALLAGRESGEPVWPDRTGTARGQWWETGAKMLRADLAAAGIPYRERGQVFDFHALRAQFITDLDRAGVSQSRAQRHARHSTPALTAKYYTKPGRDELAADVNRLKR